MDMTSSSMVDLPVGILNGGSCEHLDQVEEGYLSPHSSSKSRSVPRLTLMSVSAESERGEWCVCVTGLMKLLLAELLLLVIHNTSFNFSGTNETFFGTRTLLGAPICLGQ